ncbi:MAG: methylated-DNA--[protein]-cysteine S-methyltransferase [Myxococcaceae bacterium]|nr:methylated-DNA--[protein]-cysteine S-methyltransferase [Myxococcaceae bacterium]MBH2006298.1 methylated-DNA--[protein]-cysteine S-methyltransferase [Myxococcaceae bacterium]
MVRVKLRIETNEHAITGVYFSDLAISDGHPPLIAQVLKELEEYEQGLRQEFTVPLELKGTEFQLRVWAALQRIPYGQTRTYAEIAKEIGSPQAARAVGLANSKNPISILVPCHRVIGANGKLTGYAGGIPNKAKLLEIEQRFRRGVAKSRAQ